MSAPLAPPTSPVAEGDVVAGKYRIEKIIGRGGMGIVVAARHMQLDDRVAIKFMGRDAAELPEFVERFAREARASIKIRSEHVVRVLDVDALPGGVPYIVMEYLEGRSLAQLLRKHGPLPPQQAVDYMIQACEALAAAHGIGVVHRDIKPSNLFLTKRLDGTDCVKVLDFGISKFLESSAEDDSDLTGSLSLVGSPNYMAPEQMMAAKTVDARADIWSFGAMLFKLLSGQTPFESGPLPVVVTAILNSDPKNLRELAAVPEGLALVVERCLQKDRAQRYESMAELALALAPFGTEEAGAQSVRIQRVAGLETEGPPSSRRLLDAQLDPTAGPGQTISVRQPALQRERRRLAPILVAVAAALGVSLWFAWSKYTASVHPAPDDSAYLAAQSPAEPPKTPPKSGSTQEPAAQAPAPPSSATPDSGAQSEKPKPVRSVRRAAPTKTTPIKAPAPASTASKSGLDLFSDPK